MTRTWALGGGMDGGPAAAAQAAEAAGQDITQWFVTARAAAGRTCWMRRRLWVLLLAGTYHKPPSAAACKRSAAAEPLAHLLTLTLDPAGGAASWGGRARRCRGRRRWSCCGSRRTAHATPTRGWAWSQLRRGLTGPRLRCLPAIIMQLCLWRRPQARTTWGSQRSSRRNAATGLQPETEAGEDGGRWALRGELHSHPGEKCRAAQLGYLGGRRCRSIKLHVAGGRELCADRGRAVVDDIGLVALAIV
jgi:hypothetical protein